MSPATLKTLKGGKTEADIETRTMTIRGTEYVIRELDVVEYKECLKAATNKEGFTPFGDLLEAMVMRTVTPSPLSRSKPLPYPIYRMLEGAVNEMHFSDIEEPALDPEAPEEESTEVPNSSQLSAEPKSV